MLPQWRLIDSGPGCASYNMAMDEAIALSVRRHGAPPTLRFYGWDSLSLSIGCFQKSADLDLAYCTSHDIPVVRRPTGGRAILHDSELTYAFSARTDHPRFSRGLLDSYRSISSAFCLAFKKIGVAVEARMTKERGRVLTGSPLCFSSSSYGEILVDRRKLVGAAQKRWHDGLLQQGSVPYAYDEESMRHIFGAHEHRQARECRAALREAVTDFSEQKLKDAIIGAFGETFGVSLQVSPPSLPEIRLAQELETQKYLLDSWNFHR